MLVEQNINGRLDTAYVYGSASMLVAEELYNGKKTTKLAYAYDADGNLVSETGKIGTEKVEKSYEYDVLTKHRAEVLDVCLTEYNEKVFINGIHEEGREEGRKEGLIKGENRLGKLISLLLSDGRIEDAQKVASNEEARKQFYREYGITD